MVAGFLERTWRGLETEVWVSRYRRVRACDPVRLWDEEEMLEEGEGGGGEGSSLSPGSLRVRNEEKLKRSLRGWRGHGEVAGPQNHRRVPRSREGARAGSKGDPRIDWAPL